MNTGFGFLVAVPILALAAVTPAARAENEIQAKLDATTDMNKVVDSTLKDALQFLAEKFDAKIIIDEKAFLRVKNFAPGDTKTKMLVFKGAMLDTLLRLLLNQANAVYEVRENTITVVPNVKGGKLVGFPPLSDERKRAIEKQRERIAEVTQMDIEKPIDAPLNEVIRMLSDKQNIVMVLDWGAFERRKIKNVGSMKIKLPITQDALEEIFKKVFSQVKGKYELMGDHIVIVPAGGK